MPRPTVPLLALALPGLLGFAACRAPASGAGWDGELRSWGSMRDVMRSGATQGRVSLAEVLDSERVVGLGALEGLTGELAIVDGQAWVARVGEGGVRVTRGERAEDRATLLAVTEVGSWREVVLERDLAPGELEDWLAARGAEAGLPAEAAWPFVVEGELFSLETHVLNGRCPYAGELDAAHEPFRRTDERVAGTLVGFHAPGAAGTLVHHGQALHVHAVLADAGPWVGHVDEAGVRAGARVRLPRR